MKTLIRSSSKGKGYDLVVDGKVIIQAEPYEVCAEAEKKYHEKNKG